MTAPSPDGYLPHELPAAVLRPDMPVVIDASPRPGSLLFRRGDRGTLVRHVHGSTWVVRLDATELDLTFDADEFSRCAVTP